MVREKIVASELLLESAQRHGIHLSLLVADTGLWASADFHRRIMSDTGCPAMFPKVRRARVGQSERRGQVCDGVRFDDNTYANVAIKRAIGLHRGQALGFEACHIWPLTCYDERFHTAIANIVLLPRALAGLSDHDEEIQKVLQYRACELYSWWPDDQSQPERPDFFPSSWREPRPDPMATGKPSAATRESTKPGGDKTAEENRRVLTARILEWSAKPHLNVHKIIAIVAETRDGVPRDQLVRKAADVTNSKNAYGAVASLLTDRGNAYGRVFEDDGGIVRLHPVVAQQVRSLEWHVE